MMNIKSTATNSVFRFCTIKHGSEMKLNESFATLLDILEITVGSGLLIVSMYTVDYIQ